MDAAETSRALIVIFGVVDLWGVFCGVDLVRTAWRLRKVTGVLQGYAEMGLYMTMNATLWLLILAQAFIWPAPPQPGVPVWRQAATSAIFFMASATITLALHRGKMLLLGGTSALQPVLKEG